MPSPIRIDTFVDPQFGENAYVVWTRPGGPCWFIDPGFPPSGANMAALARREKLVPEALILTHGHLDHIAGVPQILEAFPDLPIIMADEASSALTNPNDNLSAGYGFPISLPPQKTRDMPAGSTLILDGNLWQILDSSGHAPGSRSLYQAEAGVVIVGDALFYRSVGRMDFHHSDGEQLVRNIKSNLLTLPDETKVYSGHGPVTTIGAERRYNPYVGDAAEE